MFLLLLIISNTAVYFSWQRYDNFQQVVEESGINASVSVHIERMTQALVQEIMWLHILHYRLKIAFM